MLRNKTLPFLLGIVLLALFLTAAVLPRLFTAYGQKEMFEAWEKPAADHLLGTNALGYDVFTELVYGTRDTLFIGLMSNIFTLLLGVVIGTLAAQSGVLGGLFDGIINVFVLLPRLITLIVLSAFIGTGRWHLIALICSVKLCFSNIWLVAVAHRSRQSNNCSSLFQRSVRGFCLPNLVLFGYLLARS